MKKMINLSLSSMVICLLTCVNSINFPIHAKPWENYSQELTVVNAYNLTEQNLNKIMQGDHPEMAIEFSAGTCLPISLFLKGSLINLMQNEEKLGQIEVRQTFYVHYTQDKLMLSFDLNEWKSLLEFITGNLSITLSIRDGQPFIMLGAEINKRN